MVANILGPNFYFAKMVTWPKFEEPLSQKIFFNAIWLKVEEHEQIYITEIKCLKILFRFKMAAKNFFVTLCNNADFIFFPPKDVYLIFRQLQK